jgi:uncharacterized protein (TIGR03790 family)
MHALLAALLVLAGGRMALAQGPDNVLVVVNGATPESIEVGEYYLRKRRIPSEQLLRISLPPAEQIPRDVYEQRIEQPIGNWIAERRAHDRILYIVLTKGIPLRIAGTTGRSGSISSVDSELTMLYRKMAGQPVPSAGQLPNPYFLGTKPIAEARAFSHEATDIFLVTRLDGYTVADVLALIDRGSAGDDRSSAPREGRFVLDQRGSITPEVGNLWLERAAVQLRGLGVDGRVLLDTSAEIVRNQKDVIGYFSWGSNDPQMTTRQNGLSFEPGAIAGSFVSTDGRTFKEPPAQWTHGRWDDPRTFFGGSPQSLTGDLIRQGITGIAANVAEPFLDATVRPDVLFPAYVSGFTLAESYYLALPYLSWQGIVIGDPLAAPFRRQPRSLTTDAGVDPKTELPAWFSTRALKAAASRPGGVEAAEHVLRAQSRLARDDTAGAVEVLEQLIAKNATLVEPQLLLAGLYERNNEMPKAIERYRKVVSLAPANVTGLNNLAFALAVHEPAARAEALTAARRAAALAPRAPAVLDTLAWVLHLSGDNASARAPMAAALKMSPNSSDLLVHGAAIDVAAGDLPAAKIKLDRALALEAGLESRPDVQQLKTKLAAIPSREPRR